MKRRWLLAAICLTALLGVERLYYFQNGGFRTSKLISDLTPTWEQPPAEIDALLNQIFYFLGRGGTSFAFLGKDGKTVLKLFKHQHLFPKHFLLSTRLPGIADSLRIERIVASQKKQAHKHHAFFFKSCSLAFNALKEETGLLYLCIRPNLYFNRSITLIDRWGFSHQVTLSQTEFAIQKKADPLLPYLGNLLKEGKKEEGKQVIDAVLQQMRRRCDLGIGDRDPNLAINFGLVDGKVVEFDLGSYFRNSALKAKAAQTRELLMATQDLQVWLEKHSPELLEYLLERTGSAFENGKEAN
jgi:hypothetical protein